MATISSLATAGGTLVLGLATFASIRSANRSARVAERSLLAAQRPVLIPSRDDDPDERVRFGDGFILVVEGHGGKLALDDGRLYMAMSLRNGGAGLAVIHGWHVQVPEEGLNLNMSAPEPTAFRRQSRDLYIPPNQTGFWQGAIREHTDPDHAALRSAAESGARVHVCLLYGDYEGGQRTIARFGITSEANPDGLRADVLRYWNVDGDDPR